jgi:hypothetical protein
VCSHLKQLFVLFRLKEEKEEEEKKKKKINIITSCLRVRLLGVEGPLFFVLLLLACSGFIKCAKISVSPPRNSLRASAA